MSTIHNPKHFEPSDYEIVDTLDNRRPVYYGQGVESFEEEVKWWEADMLRVYGPDWRKKIHHCVHCGNGNVRWITAAKHVPSGDVVTFGVDCTERLGFANRNAFKLAQLKSKAEAGHARIKLWKEREAFVAANPEIGEALAKIKEPVHAKNWFAIDVLSKLDRYGSLSERQVAAVLASLKRDVEFAARKAAEAAEVKGDAPEGRVEVSGVVVGLKVYESAFGDTLKMTLKLANNAKVWLTVPSKATVERGDKVTVTATFKRSDKDASFAFGKRPTGIAVEPKPVAVEEVA